MRGELTRSTDRTRTVIDSQGSNARYSWSEVISTDLRTISRNAVLGSRSCLPTAGAGGARTRPPVAGLSTSRANSLPELRVSERAFCPGPPAGGVYDLTPTVGSHARPTAP